VDENLLQRFVQFLLFGTVGGLLGGKFHAAPAAKSVHHSSSLPQSLTSISDQNHCAYVQLY
jgi:hypothetical protein